MRHKNEEGQAIIAVTVAMGIFLIAALGLAVDGSHMYSQRQMAQTAADATAMAAMLSVYDGTYSSGTTSFTASPGTSFTCSTTDAKLPCRYARQNGFGGNASDTVTIGFPSSPSTAAPGVTFSTPSASSFPSVLIQVSVTRNVNTTLMGMLGITTSTVKATAMAAIVDVFAPVPILITHPTLSGSYHINGGIALTITGGPPRSVEVNSNSSTAVTVSGGSGTIDLSLAGPNGNGADFGVQGGPATATPPFTFVAGTRPGQYIPGASWIKDPLENISPPGGTGAPDSVPVAPGAALGGTAGISVAAGVSTNVGGGPYTCPSSAGSHGCTIFSPGLYTGGALSNLKNTTAMFRPGIYYIEGGGLQCLANCNAMMASGYADPAAPNGTGTSWDGTSAANGGMLIYNTGATGTPTATGPINIGANGSASLIGAPTTGYYKGILFFQDRSADAQTHSLGGGGALTIVGTIYATNSRATMLGASTHFQEVDLQGNPGSSTQITGEIITGVLGMGGNAGITMNLSNVNQLIISQIALVN